MTSLQREELNRLWHRSVRAELKRREIAKKARDAKHKAMLSKEELFIYAEMYGKELFSEAAFREGSYHDGLISKSEALLRRSRR